jgi:hypothetical protein
MCILYAYLLVRGFVGALSFLRNRNHVIAIGLLPPWASMAATPNLLASASFIGHTSPRRTNNIGDAYVLQIARTASHYVASASAPKNTIHLFDRSSFAPVRALAGHEGGTSALAVALRRQVLLRADMLFSAAGKMRK